MNYLDQELWAESISGLLRWLAFLLVMLSLITMGCQGTTTTVDSGTHSLPDVSTKTSQPSVETEQAAMYQGNAQRTGEYGQSGTIPANFEKWKVEVGGAQYLPPTVANGVIYVAGADGYLFALEAKSGQETWRVKEADSLITSPVYYDGMVFVGSQTGEIFGLDADTGREVWQVDTSVEKGGILSAFPVIDKGVLYFSTWEYDLIALDAKTGQEKWRYDPKNGHKSTNGQVFSPAVADGLVICGNGNGYGGVYAVNAETGHERWRLDIYPTSSPSIAGGFVYFAERESLRRVNAQTGVEVVRYPLVQVDSYTSVHEDDIFVGIDFTAFGKPEGYLAKIDAATGNEQWRFKTGHGGAGDVALADGYAYFTGRLILQGGDEVHAVNIRTGKEKWKFMRGDTMFGNPIVADGMVYVRDNKGFLFALGADIAVTPEDGACVGGNVTLTGSGMPEGTVALKMISMGASGFVDAPLGVAMADAGGYWSLTTTVPTESSHHWKDQAHGQQTYNGHGDFTWDVEAVGGDGVRKAQGLLTVLNCLVSNGAS